MIADPSAQLRLLDLQAVDTALAQLGHRRQTLPELAAITAAATRSAELDANLVEAQTRRDDLAIGQRRLENEVDTVRTRASRDDQRLTSGGLPSKELESLQHEITSLARRQSGLEDELLEVMEQVEAADVEVKTFAEQRDAAVAERAELERRRDLEFESIDHATRTRTAERSSVAAEIPGELLSLYEKVAAANGGVGAAALHQRRCQGCHLELAGNELTAVRAASADTVVRCENCRRILVRTSESGL